MAPGQDLSFDMVAAALRADTADVTLYARVLTESLGQALPGCVAVERVRSMSDRLHGRPGAVSGLTVRLGEQVLTLDVPPGAAPRAQICHEVRGVVLSRQPVGIREWAGELVRALLDHAKQNAQAAEALRRLVMEA